MSKEQKPNTAVNLYSVYNEELTRMHELMQAYIRLPKRDHYEQNNVYSTSTTPSHQMGMIFARITAMQDVLIEALQSHEPLIQEKVAELALIGVKDEA